MGLTPSLSLAIALAVASTSALGCSAETGKPMTQIDAAGSSSGCTVESDCGAPTPYCEPTSSTCVECRFSSHCSSTNSVCDAQACRTPHTCKELKAELPGLPSGVYRIDLDGSGTLAPLDVFCEMTVDGGGWTLVQRTRWAWAQSQALHSNFAAWHDGTVGTPGTGNVYRLAGMHWKATAPGGELMVAHRVRTTSNAGCNPLFYVAKGGTLTINRTAQTATFTGLVQPASLVANPPAALRTTNSGPVDSELCVNTNNGVPWFHGSCCSTCPTYQGTYWNDEPHPMAGYVHTVQDFFGKLETDVCAGQTPRIADNAMMVTTAYRGIDTMEMYLR